MNRSVSLRHLLIPWIAIGASAANLTWDMETQFGVSKENAKPGTDQAIAAAVTHFKQTPTDTITLQFRHGTYNFRGKTPPILLGRGDDVGNLGRLVFQGDGLRKTTFIATDPTATFIESRGWKHLTFRGIHFARNYITVSQGDVIDVAPQEITVQLHEGFPNPIELAKIPGKAPHQGKYLRKYDGNPQNPQIILENNQQIPWDMDQSQFLGRGKIRLILRGKKAMESPFKIGEHVGIKVKHGGGTYFFAGGNDIVFEKCLWTHQARGVLRGGINKIRFTACRIERLPQIGNRTPFMATPGGGPQIGQPNDPDVSDVLIEDCYFAATGDDNLAIFNGVGATIRNTYSANAFARCILLHTCTDTHLTNNTIENGILLSLDEKEIPQKHQKTNNQKPLLDHQN